MAGGAEGVCRWNNYRGDGITFFFQRKYIPAAPHDSHVPGCGPRQGGRGRLERPKMATPDLGDSGLVPLFELVLVRG